MSWVIVSLRPLIEVDFVVNDLNMHQEMTKLWQSVTEYSL